MDIELDINSANDYAIDIGAKTYHPHVSIIHYDEVGKIHHTLCRFNVYAIFFQKNFPSNLTYGMGAYSQENRSLLAYSPGQIGGKADDGVLRQYYGWVLIFDGDFIQGTDIERKLGDYRFFEYNSNEALYLTYSEKITMGGVMESIRDEMERHSGEPASDRIVRDMIGLVLDYCSRFYIRQTKDVVEGRQRHSHKISTSSRPGRFRHHVRGNAGEPGSQGGVEGVLHEGLLRA